MSALNLIYRSLEPSTHMPNGGYAVADIPGKSNHKLGLSNNGLPVFFIQCRATDRDNAVADYNLDAISVRFNTTCQLHSEGSPTYKGIYTIVELKSGSEEIIQYFLDIVHLMLLKLPEGFGQEDLRIDIQVLIRLFVRLSAPPLKEIQGLWAELLIIEQSNNPIYLLNAWHRQGTDKFDFNDGFHKIEVKSTQQARRIHRFSADQLQQNRSSDLIIASIQLTETSSGKSVLDLSDSIAKKLFTTEQVFLLKEKIGEILGQDINRAGEVFFDYAQAKDSCALFKAEDIPKISSQHIPVQVQHVRFDCDLTGLKPVQKGTLKVALFASL